MVNWKFDLETLGWLFLQIAQWQGHEQAGRYDGPALSSWSVLSRALILRVIFIPMDVFVLRWVHTPLNICIMLNELRVDLFSSNSIPWTHRCTSHGTGDHVWSSTCETIRYHGTKYFGRTLEPCADMLEWGLCYSPFCPGHCSLSYGTIMKLNFQVIFPYAFRRSIERA